MPVRSGTSLLVLGKPEVGRTGLAVVGFEMDNLHEQAEGSSSQILNSSPFNGERVSNTRLL